jgi:hypothetical protein
VLGNPVLLHVRGKDTLIQMIDDATLHVELLADVSQLGRDGRPRQRDVVVCYDSTRGYQKTLGLVASNKMTMIVHSPAAEINNSRKAGGWPLLYLPPLLAELVAIGAMHGIDEAELRRRVYLFGPSIRYMVNHDMVLPHGVDGLLDSQLEHIAHCLLLVLPGAPNDRMLTFASD